MPSFDFKKPFDIEAFRQRYPNAYTPWEQKDDDFLKEQFALLDVPNRTETYTDFVERLAVHFKRNPGGIRSRLKLLYGDKLDQVKRKKKEKVSTKPAEVFKTMSFAGNVQAKRVLDILENTADHVFLTGRAGTGKSSLLSHFRATTKKQIAVLAPTGMAALNVSGQTIHSFCGFPADITIDRVKQIKPWFPARKILAALQTIVIDEVSMVRADLMDCLDRFLRLNGNSKYKPFGGYQMLFIGDLHQLPPVDKDFISQEEGSVFKTYDSPYFFDAKSYLGIKPVTVELQNVYRQAQGKFLDILNAIRDGSITEDHIGILEAVVRPGIQYEENNFIISLTTTNASALKINTHQLNRLTGQTKRYRGGVQGDFPDKLFPTEHILTLREGAQIMMLNNDVDNRWANGTMGSVLGFIKKDNPPPGGPDAVLVRLENGNEVEVMPHSWERTTHGVDKENGKVERKVIGRFRQYPMRLAWAVTIHKSQGQTFNRVHIDLTGGTFAHGQLYVALSRCRTLEGLTLERAVKQEDVKLDPRVITFLQGIK